MKTKNEHLPILFDVDGVLADFVGRTIELVNRRFRTNYKWNDIDCDIRKYMKEWDDGCEQYICSPGFAANLDVHEGAKELIENLRRKNYKVMFVTSPYKDSPTWGYDRQAWLTKHFSADRDDVVICHNKRYVQGSILIDDLPRNCEEWSSMQDKTSILLDRPWNKNDVLTNRNIERVNFKDLEQKITTNLEFMLKGF